MSTTVWPVQCRDLEDDSTSTIAIGATLEAAQNATHDFCGEALEWRPRNGIFDPQDYLVAIDPNGDCEYHVHEFEVAE